MVDLIYNFCLGLATIVGVALAFAGVWLGNRYRTFWAYVFGVSLIVWGFILAALAAYRLLSIWAPII